ncbi:HDIG domain-containing metalloprotein [uncultured Sphaerochaeta sp.]|uniref:HDIG domain-containing metalloprotein n=1 Tax=uncultured Sphaerochaeta sp. TaxID=886478 RepID=UPI002A0A71E2|nr:HDIG domain-containing metalloprotein [uncultured Sphaerochaeta sp.]
MSKRMKRSFDGLKAQRQEQVLLIVLTILIMTCAMFIPIALLSNPSGTIRSISSKYKSGQLANEDVFATSSFQYLDVDKTNERRKEEYAKITPSFSFSLNGTATSMARLKAFQEAWNTPASAQAVLKNYFSDNSIYDTANVIGRFSTLPNELRTTMVEAVSAAMEILLQNGLFSQKDIDALIQQGYQFYSMTNKISLKKADSIQKLPLKEAMTKENLEEALHSWLVPYVQQYSDFQPVLLFDALRLLSEENVVYDEATTLFLQTNIEKHLTPIYINIKQGQKIITHDTVITDEQLDLLSKMTNSTLQYSWMELFGRSVFILIVTFGSLYLFLMVLRDDKRFYLYTNLMLISVLASEVALYFLSRFITNSAISMLDSYLPILFAPVFISHITSKKRLGLITAFLLSSYTMILPQSTSITFFFGMAAAGSCLYCFQFSGKRLDDVFNWFYACISSSFLALCLNLLSGIAFSAIIPFMGGLIINITISIVLVDVLVPLFERLFNIPTAYRLSELAFADSPVLDRLGALAQGTYNHSRYVSELAYNAAKAIGANAMLARVGGMYHDIGKADHPEYFVENQGQENKHDDIKPSLSVAIIKSHVKLGIEKGRDAGLPQEVLDIIAQHHGDDVIHYFYNEAKQEAAKTGREVKREDYSYNGNPPTSPEAAIVMLSDCVEAASRTLKKPNPAKYDKLIHSIILGKIERDQLKHSRLSLTDLDVVGSSFLQTLIGRDHHRIEYPDEILQDDNTQSVNAKITKTL